MIISSQRYLDDNTVQTKRDAHDYVVIVSPEFAVDGVMMQAVIDGHHSLAAAEADGVEPEFVVASVREDDRVALLEHSVDDYLAVCHIDSDWYDIYTGKAVF